ncbi:hypothetical protein F7725_024240 [Dissostichus mawsoni]|uniref:Uncharacterized protein n=1 Tax=Dissostichus mawsoni TaxID=36200 RepID=A0A7J5Y0B9_DISMA|nr:hypothetical protein F7725_024240 [Dissostichus mawsoni]
MTGELRRQGEQSVVSQHGQPQAAERRQLGLHQSDEAVGRSTSAPISSSSSSSSPLWTGLAGLDSASFLMFIATTYTWERRLDNMAWELGLWYGGKLFNDVLQGLQAGHPQLVAVVCGRHEGHADEVRQMEHQLISWIEKQGLAGSSQVKVRFVILTQQDDATQAVRGKYPRHPAGRHRGLGLVIFAQACEHAVIVHLLLQGHLCRVSANEKASLQREMTACGPVYHGYQNTASCPSPDPACQTERPPDRLSLSELPQTGHGSAAQQQVRAAQVHLQGSHSTRQGTRLDRLTWRGANMCSCCKQDMAAACTRESEWSCIMAQPTRQDERMVEIVAPFPGKNTE